MSRNTFDLKICIAGAGMGGLTAALALAKRGFRHIEVYEAASNLGFVGAGIQLAPNMARIQDALGVWKEIEKDAVVLEEASIREGADDFELSTVDVRGVRAKYGYASMVGHRASLAAALYEGCKAHRSAITFHFATSVSSVTSFSPHVTFTAVPRDESLQPCTITADIFLACDGVKSIARASLLNALNYSAHAQDTGQAAYRIMLTREQMSQDPELLELLDGNRFTRWIGPKRHIIAYPVSGKSIYNISTLQPDTSFAAAPSATYTTKGSKSAMMDVYGDFCPKVQRMLNLVPQNEVCEWKLRVHARLPTWVYGNLALVGDACHPTLPHLNQGAAQAIEDAAVLAVTLSHLKDGSSKSVNEALRAYETVRKERAETLVELAAANGRAMHLSDADEEARAERDDQFKALREGGGSGVSLPSPDKSVDGQEKAVGEKEEETPGVEQSLLSDARALMSFWCVHLSIYASTARRQHLSGTIDNKH
ncbi:hypothetical protein FH972_021278 [Carpinus fangiana]|uniref:FAD-binding domain-containing protein n=1 Tax=Carpinus fangiana TaxID=176857 RepID=A0A5N6KP30_9ROSI|nr:hypothetical protein FH972_021278 [Carpinus fangiana]